ncbi:MAG: SIS domain-containing protein [Firmicutes bacterium]|nr:SIS domain-containing protein [Bacillota bacterium]
MDYTQTQMYREMCEQPDILAGMRARLSKQLAQIAAAVKKENPQYAVTAARGSSNNACTYFKYLCETHVGLPCASAAPSVYTVYDGALKIRNALVIGVSQSGKAADAIAVLEKAAAAGSITVAVTNDPDSPMAKCARFHIYLQTGPEISVAATKTFTAQMYALLLLAEALCGSKALQSAAEKIPAGAAQTLLLAEIVAKAAKQFTDLDSAVVLGRGTNYSAALECALKMQETTYIQTKAYASSDFYHGPFAILDEKSTVLLLAPRGECYQSMCDALQACQKAGAQTVVFTDADIADIKGTRATLKVPSGTDIETPFYNVLTAQMFANALSAAKGLNPDAPRGLNKVTVTL